MVQYRCTEPGIIVQYKCTELFIIVQYRCTEPGIIVQYKCTELVISAVQVNRCISHLMLARGWPQFWAGSGGRDWAAWDCSAASLASAASLKNDGPIRGQ